LLTIFRGESTHKMDQKGRVSIPADYRRIIIEENAKVGKELDQNTLVIVFGDNRQNHLECYPLTLSREIHENIKSKFPRGTPKREFLDNFFETKSIAVQIDPNGRMLLPQHVRTKAELGSNVCFAGKGESFQIWNPEKYSQRQKELEAMFRDDEVISNPLVLLE